MTPRTFSVPFTDPLTLRDCLARVSLSHPEEPAEFVTVVEDGGRDRMLRRVLRRLQLDEGDEYRRLRTRIDEAAREMAGDEEMDAREVCGG